MGKKNVTLEGEQGSIILMTLLIFFIICILMILIMQLSVLEMHMSKYYFRTQQAQQLADAILEQTCADINQHLRTDYCNSQTIPVLPLGWRESSTEVVTGSGKGQCHTRFLSLDSGSDYCRYKIKCVGCFENASKIIEAEVTFHFTNNCDAEHKSISRTFTDNGTITAYRIIND